MLRLKKQFGQALERLRIELTGTAAEKEKMMEEKEREEPCGSC